MATTPKREPARRDTATVISVRDPYTRQQTGKVRRVPASAGWEKALDVGRDTLTRPKRHS